VTSDGGDTRISIRRRTAQAVANLSLFLLLRLPYSVLDTINPQKLSSVADVSSSSRQKRVRPKYPFALR